MLWISFYFDNYKLSFFFKFAVDVLLLDWLLFRYVVPFLDVGNVAVFGYDLKWEKNWFIEISCLCYLYFPNCSSGKQREDIIWAFRGPWDCSICSQLYWKLWSYQSKLPSLLPLCWICCSFYWPSSKSSKLHRRAGCAYWTTDCEVDILHISSSWPW